MTFCCGPVPSPYSANAPARVNSEIALAAAMSRSRPLARSQTQRAHDATDTSFKLTCLLTRARLPQSSTNARKRGLYAKAVFGFNVLTHPNEDDDDAIRVAISAMEAV